MGEFADMALSETMDAEDLRLVYRMGGISDGDAYEYGLIDHLGYATAPPMFGKSPMSITKTCRACGKPGLKWGTADHGWRLFDGTSVHTCANYKPRTT